MSYEQALKEISVLVNDFKANEQHYLNPTYSEADVRDDFINENQHGDIGLLVDQMLTSKKQLKQTKTQSDKNYLQRNRDILDKRINELACLTADKFIGFMD